MRPEWGAAELIEPARRGTVQAVVVPSDVVVREVDGEAVLLNLETGKYFGLNRAGARMFRALSERGSIRGACMSLLAGYEVSAEQLEADLVELVATLVDHGLLRLATTTESTVETDSQTSGRR